MVRSRSETLPIALFAVCSAAAGALLLAWLSRYSSTFPLDLGEVEPAKPAILEIPGDASSQAWELRLSELRAATVCGRGG